MGWLVRGRRMYGHAELSPVDLAEETGPGGGVISPRGLLLFVGKIRRTGDFRDAALK